METKETTKGFTLIELLVVIAIIGLLSSVIFASVNSARTKSRTARTKADLNQIRLSIEMLFHDTMLHPGKISTSPCVQNPEILLNSCAAGLACTDGGFSDWSGPYLNSVSLDPWGNNYIFDPDFTCNTGVLGCEGISNDTIVRAVHSGGPNGSGINQYDSDNIVLVLCK